MGIKKGAVEKSSHSGASRVELITDVAPHDPSDPHLALSEVRGLLLRVLSAGYAGLPVRSQSSVI